MVFLGERYTLYAPFWHLMKRFIGLSTTLTPDFLRYYALSLEFSAKHVPTLVDFPHVLLKTEKYQIYQGINYVLQNTSCSLVLLDRLLSAKFVISRQNFDTPGNFGAGHRFGVSPASSWDLNMFWPTAMLMPESLSGKSLEWYEVYNPAKAQRGMNKVEGFGRRLLLVVSYYGKEWICL